MSAAPGHLVVVGDALLDRDVTGRVERVCPDAPAPVLDEQGRVSRPGGAGLAACLAAADGWRVTLVTALAADGPGEELRSMLAGHGVEVADLGLEGATPEKVRLVSGGHPLMRLDRGDGSRCPGSADPGPAASALSGAPGVLVADYGRGVAAHPGVRSLLEEIAGAGRAIVWDPHPRGAPPVRGVALASPNAREARSFAGAGAEGGAGGLVEAGRELLGAWGIERVCVTRSGNGALLVSGDGSTVDFPTHPVQGDPCGAGDRFASRVAQELTAGAAVERAVASGVEAATAMVASGGPSGVLPRRDRLSASALGEPSGFSPEPAIAAVERCRAAGGRVVATGGCFDLLHVGHLQTLQGARSLGDCLIVCLNGDRSVRRLKGPDRPVMPEADRARMLRALECVDEVLLFDEPDPSECLRALRPDVWVKGGDYSGRRLPEAEALAECGAEIVFVPLLEDRSTTKIIEEATHRAID